MSIKAQIEVRLLTESDVAAALRLQQLEGWNQTQRDWRRLLELEPTGCFTAWLGGHLVATVTTTTYGRELAWIGMMLVTAEYRRQGIARRLLSAALDYLHAAGIAVIKLDATPVGRPVYETLGFVSEGMIERWETIAQAQIVKNDQVPDAAQSLSAEIREQILALDRLAYGVDRARLLDALIADSNIAPQVVMSTNRMLQGYAMARRGLIASYVGPIIAEDERVALTLLDRILAQLKGEQIYLDFHTGYAVASEELLKRGFIKQRELVRMHYGNEKVATTSPQVFAIAGPEVG